MSSFESHTEDRSSEYMRLWTQHQNEVYGFIVAMVWRWSDADDILQETALAAYQDFAQFRHGTDFARWAKQIAWNRVQRWRRTQSRDILLFSDEFLSTVAAATDEVEDSLQQRRRLLETCVQRLVESDRRMLAAYFAANNKVQAVAEVLRRSAHSVSQSLYRIRGTLFHCVELRLTREEQA